MPFAAGRGHDRSISQGFRAHRRDHPYLHSAHRKKSRLCGGWKCVLRREERSGLRQALASKGRGAGIRPARLGRRGGEEKSGGFCPMEIGQGRRADLGFALGQRPPGLAYRMFGHVDEIPGRDIRFPRRRARSAFSTSRKRIGPIGERHRQAICPPLAAQRPDADENEDGQRRMAG